RSKIVTAIEIIEWIFSVTAEAAGSSPVAPASQTCNQLNLNRNPDENPSPYEGEGRCSLLFCNSAPTARRLPHEIGTLCASVREADCNPYDGVGVDLVLISRQMARALFLPSSYEIIPTT